MADREAALMSVLEGVVDPTFMSDPTTPQGAAFSWLLNTDTGTDPCDSLQVVQRYALAVLYESTNGDNWAVNNEWLSPFSVCEWYEVQCMNDGVTVEQLALYDNNLNGTLPWELRALTSLRGFNVFFNSLVGTVPDYFSAWPNLILFDVENNTLYGDPLGLLDRDTDLNDDMGTLLPDLRFFRISHNMFEGPFNPEAARQLSNIEHLWMAGNKYFGTIPTEIGLLVNLGTWEIFLKHSEVTIH